VLAQHCSIRPGCIRLSRRAVARGHQARSRNSGCGQLVRIAGAGWRSERAPAAAAHRCEDRRAPPLCSAPVASRARSRDGEGGSAVERHPAPARTRQPRYHNCRFSSEKPSASQVPVVRATRSRSCSSPAAWSWLRRAASRCHAGCQGALVAHERAAGASNAPNAPWSARGRDFLGPCRRPDDLLVTLSVGRLRQRPEPSPRTGRTSAFAYASRWMVAAV
jgi:hypothetical protein